MSESKGIIDMLNHLIMADDDTVSDYWESYLQQTIMHIERLEERCYPSKVFMIGDAGHYVSEKVYAELTRLNKDVIALEATVDRLHQIESREE